MKSTIKYISRLTYGLLPPVVAIAAGDAVPSLTVGCGAGGYATGSLVYCCCLAGACIGRSAGGGG